MGDKGKSIVPPGAPTWVTDEEIRDTLRVWQPHYKETLTPDDALEILLNVSNLLEVLLEPTPKERKPGTGGDSGDDD